MGRSVSYASGSVIVNYIPLEDYDYDMLIEDFRESLKSQFKSLIDCEEWLDREDLAIVENGLVYIGVSEYCDLLSLWITPKDSINQALALNWIEKIRAKFEKYGTLNKVGSFSNGEAVYEYKKEGSVN